MPGTPEAGGAASAAWLSLGLLLLTAVLVVLSALLERSGPIRLRHFAEEAGGRLRRLFDSPLRFEAFRYLLNLLAKAMPAALSLTLVAFQFRLGRPLGPSMLLALAGVALLILGVELVNRLLVGSDPEDALRRLTGPYRAALFVLSPLVAVVAPVLPRRMVERSGDDEEEEESDEASEEEIEAFIDVGTREGILEPDQGDLVRGVVDFGDTQVRSVMTPRIDIVCAPVDTALPDLARRFIESKHSRLPLYRGSIDHVVGILHVRDLLRGLFAEKAPLAGELAKPAYFVPLTRLLDELLRDMQVRYQQVAIVVDEYGGTAGLVTVEDLIEEIVGELGDEPDAGHGEPQQLPDGSWRLPGRTHLEELEDRFGVEIDDGPYETLGGLILSVLGEVPEFGAVVESHGLRMTVEQVSDRRIETVRVERLPPGGEPQGA